MHNYRMKIAYDGTRYQGWQRNKNAQSTIQEKMEEIIEKYLGEKVELVASGRTDKGVHAQGQVVNFLCRQEIECERFRKEVNHYLPEDIGILEMEEVDPNFHSRFRSIKKTYRYTLIKEFQGVKKVFDRKYVMELEQELDLFLVKKAVTYLLGEHDFKGFSRDKTKKSTVRNLMDIKITEDEEQYRFDFIADGFLHQMVRILMGTLIEVGHKKRSPESIKEIFEGKKREEAGFLAPASGLCLLKVDYGEKILYFTRHGETEWNIIRQMQGQKNSDLTALGKKQAYWLKEALQSVPIDAIYVSSLGRAVETAQILKGHRAIEVIPCDELQEIHLGSWEGRLISEVEKEFPEQNHAFWKEPQNYVPIDGEGFTDLIDRAARFYHNVIEKSPYSRILIVSHAIYLKALLAHLEGKSLDQFWSGPHLQPTCLTKAKVDHKGIRFEFIGDTSHYKEQTSGNGWFIDEE